MTKQTTTYKKPLKGEKADLLDAIRQDANRCHEFYDLANPHGISLRILQELRDVSDQARAAVQDAETNPATLGEMRAFRNTIGLLLGMAENAASWGPQKVWT